MQMQRQQQQHRLELQQAQEQWKQQDQKQKQWHEQELQRQLREQQGRQEAERQQQLAEQERRQKQEHEQELERRLREQRQQLRAGAGVWLVRAVALFPTARRPPSPARQVVPFAAATAGGDCSSAQPAGMMPARRAGLAPPVQRREDVAYESGSGGSER